MRSTAVGTTRATQRLVFFLRLRPMLFSLQDQVVKYSGTLHDKSYPWMREDAETADLCLVLGTSLGGLNADQAKVGKIIPCGHAALWYVL